MNAVRFVVEGRQRGEVGVGGTDLRLGGQHQHDVGGAIGGDRLDPDRVDHLGRDRCFLQLCGREVEDDGVVPGAARV